MCDKISNMCHILKPGCVLKNSVESVIRAFYIHLMPMFMFDYYHYYYTAKQKQEINIANTSDLRGPGTSGTRQMSCQHHWTIFPIILSTHRESSKTWFSARILDLLCVAPCLASVLFIFCVCECSSFPSLPFF